MRQQINLLEAITYVEGSAPADSRMRPWISIGLLVLAILAAGGAYREYGEGRSLEAKLAELQVRTAALAGSQAAGMSSPILPGLLRHTRWSLLMQEISLIVPDGVWTTRWEGSAEGEGGGVRVKLTGGARSQERLSAFLTALDRSPIISDPKLSYSRRVNSEVQFELSLGLRGEGPR